MVKVTHHSIDRASLRMMNLWVTEAKKEEGLVKCLARLAEEALGITPDDKSILRRLTEIVISRAQQTAFLSDAFLGNYPPTGSLSTK